MSAYIQYMDSLKAARYNQLAQKLDFLLSNLHQDPNTQVRWIWQLIQNAKDVSNQFSKVKIRISVDERSMTFSHNGDPFRPADLESVVGQYSKKVEENNNETETTGKYGTGFVTTYVLSRKIKVRGILVTDDMQEDMEDSDENKSESESEKQQEKVENCEDQADSCSKINFVPLEKIEQPKFSFSNIEKVHKKAVQELKNQEDQISEDSQPPKKVFQKFQIPLNRKYKNRQKDLPKILKRNEIKIMKILAGLHNQEPWQRKIDDFDTSFTYQKLDKTAFKMIAKGINTLKQYFPYALCFNKKLFQIEVQDNRISPHFANFTITKEESQKLQVEDTSIQLAVCTITENEKNTKHYLAFRNDPKTRCTIAIPIQIGEKVKLLKISNKMPKAFKEFPLIGVKDTGYNFAFTSQNFYPNQTRSNLLLNKVQGRENKKANQNWQALKSIFELNISLTQALSKIIRKGQQNFIQVTEMPFMGNQHEIFKKYFQRYLIQHISNLKIVEFKNGNIGTLKELIYMNDLSNHKTITNQEASTELNEIFSFFFQTSDIMSAQIHKNWHLNLNKNQKFFLKIIKFKNIDDCLCYIDELNYQDLQQMLDTQAAVVEKMRQIYIMLQKYKPQYLNFKTLNNQKKKIVLTKSCQLKCLRQNKVSQILKVKTNLPQCYEELCKFFQININSYLIHEQLAHFFKNNQKFSIKQANQTIADFFELSIFSQNKQTDYEQMHKYKFKALLRYLKSLKINQQMLQMIEQLIDYSRIQILPINLNQFQELSQTDKHPYLVCVSKIFLKRVDEMITEDMSVLAFSTKFVDYKGNIHKIIEWYDKLLKIKISKQILKRNVTWSNHFRLHNNLKNMKIYPNQQDIAIYDKIIPGKEQKTSFFGNWNGNYQQLKKLIVHPEINHNYSKTVGYDYFFAPLNQEFKNIMYKQTKKDFLEYIHQIYKRNEKEKMVFDKLANQRQVQLMKIQTFDKNQVSALYDLAQNKEVLPKLHELYSKFGIDKLMQIMKDYDEIEAAQNDAK